MSYIANKVIHKNVFSGFKSGHLTLINRFKKEDKNGKNVRYYWKCLCDCGNYKDVREYELKSERVSTCGCQSWGHNITVFKYKDNDTKKGEKYYRLYRTWCGMRGRCRDSGTYYPEYSGRGIKVCEEWEQSYSAFKEWSIKNGYNDNLNGHEQSLDRIDVNGNYSPDNCRWTDNITQGRNKTDTVYAEINGISKPLIEWCEIYGAPYPRTLYRYHHSVRGEKLFAEKYNI